MKDLTTKEAARRLGYKGDAQIRKLIQRGQLKPERLGKAWAISVEELSKFEKDRKQAKKKTS
jgi:excisionase family DNA binding protein